MKNNSLPGLTISSPLFFNADETIDYDTLGRYLDDVCANQMISAVYSMAYNTRYRMLSDSEVLEVNRFVIRKVKSHGHKVYVGHPYVFTKRSLENYLEEISTEMPDGISMLYPERYYNIDEPIINFLKAPLKFGLNVVLHEMKLISGFNGELVDWPLSLLEKVFEEVPLVAIKEDSKSNAVTYLVLSLSKRYGVHCVLAGGGKIRAQEFIEQGMSTWLNGSTMFIPHLIDKTYSAFVEGDKDYQDWYLGSIEKPFFEDVVATFGWHLAHKAALEYFGYGERYERFPHAELRDEDYENATKTFVKIKNAIDTKVN
ncbi:hypothetical protein OAD42_02765 [Oceanospirillaceae bacterium]|nr:hypothetical protein [Oceanospirillaceae bacterium]